MSTEDNKALVRRLTEEGFNQGNMAAYDEIYAPDYVDHTPYVAGQAPGLEGAKEAYRAYRTAFPDGRLTIEDLIAEGDRVVARMTFRGTHLGSFAAVPPTGRPVVMNEIAIQRFAGGKVVEEWHTEDDLGLMQALDVVPAIALTPAER